MTAANILKFFALALVWGSSFVLIRVMADAGVGGPGIASARTAIGILAIIPIAILSKTDLRQSRRTWFSLAGLGFMNFAVPWTIFGLAAPHVPSGAAAIVNSTTPLWVTIITVLALQEERVHGLRAFGVILGFGGVVVLMGDDLGNIGGAATLSMLVILVATFSYAISALFIRKNMGHVPPTLLAGGQIGFATLFLAPVALATGSYSGVDWNAGVIFSALALGIAGSAIGPIAYMGLIQQVGAIRASVVTYLIPPVGVLLGWLVLDERVGWNMIGGLALILAGVGLTQGFIRSYRRPRLIEEVSPAPAGGD